MTTEPKARPRRRVVRVPVSQQSDHAKWLLGLVATAVVTMAAAAPSYWLKAEIQEAESRYTKQVDDIKAQQGVIKLQVENSLLQQQAVTNEKTNQELAALRREVGAGFNDLRRDVGTIDKSVTDLSVRIKTIEGGKGK